MSSEGEAKPLAFALLFWRMVLRPLRREQLRTILSLLAIALGVAVVMAIHLAGQAAAGSFRASLESLSGAGDLEITAIGGVDERLLGTLAALPEPLRFSPRIEDFATVNATRETVALIGLDFIAEAAQRPQELGKLPNNGSDADAIAVDHGLMPGQTSLALTINDRSRVFPVSARMDVPDRLIVMDIQLAQEVTGKRGLLDRITVSLPPGAKAEEWIPRLRAVLPATVTVAPRGTQTEENRKMLAAFRWNLTILSYIAVIVGAFLIYNNISVSVVRRRAEIGIARALGATRGMVLGAFLGEAVMLGLVGGAVGLLLGRVMATGAVRLLGATVEALYVSSAPGEIRLDWLDAGLGLMVGVGVTVLAALAPAREASRVAPIEAMARGRQEYTARLQVRRDGWLALGLAAGAAALCQLPPVGQKPFFGYLAAGMLVLAGAFIIPAAITAVFRVTQYRVGRWFGVEGLLAVRSLVAALSRTSVLVGALSTAIAMMVSVGIMVGSFRETVVLWLDSQLGADFYLRPAGVAAADRHPTISEELAEKIRHTEGVAAVDRFRLYTISYEGMPANLASGETELVRRYSRMSFLPGESTEQILNKLPHGDYVVISEPFANKHHVRAGDSVQLPLAGAMRQFRVLGIYYDYSSERGYIVMDRDVMLKYLPDRASNSLAVYMKPGLTLEQGREILNQVCAGRRVLLFDHRSLRREALKIFDRTFAITYALEVVAVAVAIMGVAGALLALVIDRRREFGLLRFLGGATGQVRKMILAEAGALGLLANVIGLGLGIALSLVLIYVINRQSFGWTFQFHWPVAMLLGGLSLIYVTTLAAALYPARTAMRLNPIEVIHEE